MCDSGRGWLPPATKPMCQFPSSRNQQLCRVSRQSTSRRQRRCYLGIRREQFESLIDLSLLHPTTEIQEVGWLPAIEENDVTGRHGESRAVHCERKGTGGT